MSQAVIEQLRNLAELTKNPAVAGDCVVAAYNIAKAEQRYEEVMQFVRANLPREPVTDVEGTPS